MRALPRLLAVVAVGCTAGTDGVVPPDSQVTPDSPIVNEDRLIEWFTGRLTTTATVPFGGPPYCNYSMRLSNVRLDVTMDPTDGLIFRYEGPVYVLSSEPGMQLRPQQLELVGDALVDDNVRRGQLRPIGRELKR